MKFSQFKKILAHHFFDGNPVVWPLGPFHHLRSETPDRVSPGGRNGPNGDPTLLLDLGGKTTAKRVGTEGSEGDLRLVIGFFVEDPQQEFFDALCPVWHRSFHYFDLRRMCESIKLSDMFVWICLDDVLMAGVLVGIAAASFTTGMRWVARSVVTFTSPAG